MRAITKALGAIIAVAALAAAGPVAAGAATSASAAPIGAHANIAKLAAMTYGQALSQLDLPMTGDQDRHGQHE